MHHVSLGINSPQTVNPHVLRMQVFTLVLLLVATFCAPTQDNSKFSFKNETLDYDEVVVQQACEILQSLNGQTSVGHGYVTEIKDKDILTVFGKMLFYVPEQKSFVLVESKKSTYHFYDINNDNEILSLKYRYFPVYVAESNNTLVVKTFEKLIKFELKKCG